MGRSVLSVLSVLSVQEINIKIFHIVTDIKVRDLRLKVRDLRVYPQPS